MAKKKEVKKQTSKKKLKSVKKSETKTASKKMNIDEDSKLFAFLAVLLSIIGFIIALLAKKEDKYVIFYAKQSLVIFIAFLIAGAVGIVPIIGWIASPILSIIVFVLWIIALVYSLSGELKETPIIGEYARQINI